MSSKKRRKVSSAAWVASQCYQSAVSPTPRTLASIQQCLLQYIPVDDLIRLITNGYQGHEFDIMKFENLMFQYSVKQDIYCHRNDESYDEWLHELKLVIWGEKYKPLHKLYDRFVSHFVPSSGFCSRSACYNSYCECGHPLKRKDIEQDIRIQNKKRWKRLRKLRS